MTTIGDQAFMSCGLTSIAIPDSVTSIGNAVFNGCQHLTSITIPDSVTNLGNYGFSYCRSLTNVTIGNSVPSIGDGSFQACYGLTNVTIPASVSSIGREAFEWCSGLKAVYFLGNAPSCDSWEFAGDNATVFYLPGTTGWGSTFGDAPTALVGSLVGPFLCTTNNGAITITGYSGPGGEVDIPSTANGWPVTGIGDNAFASRFDLTSVTIPDSVTHIGVTAFAGCSYLTEIDVDVNNPAYSSVDGVLFDKRQTTLIQYPTAKDFDPA